VVYDPFFTTVPNEGDSELIDIDCINLDNLLLDTRTGRGHREFNQIEKIDALGNKEPPTKLNHKWLTFCERAVCQHWRLCLGHLPPICTHHQKNNPLARGENDRNNRNKLGDELDDENNIVNQHDDDNDSDNDSAETTIWMTTTMMITSGSFLQAKMMKTRFLVPIEPMGIVTRMMRIHQCQCRDNRAGKGRKILMPTEEREVLELQRPQTMANERSGKVRAIMPSCTASTGPLQ
jgi:hypothetical protein